MYRFNSGLGGVTCDSCNVLFDQDIGWKEYEESYSATREANGGKDLCWRCKDEQKRKRPAETK